MSEDVTVTEEKHSPYRWAGIAALGIFIAVCAVNIVTIDDIAYGTGKVVLSSDTQVLRSPRTGIIDDIMVREGDRISFGQPLLRVHASRDMSDLNPLRRQALELEAKKHRLVAQAEGRTVLAFPDDLIRAAPAAVLAETENFRAWASQFDSQMRVLLRQKTQHEQDARETGARMRDLKDVMRLADQTRPSLKEKDRKKLDEGLARQTEELKSLEEQLTRALAGVENSSKMINDLKLAAGGDVRTQLDETQRDLAKLARDLARPQRDVAYVNITSTVPGTVSSLRVFTPGGIVETGSPIADIHPQDGQLVMEVFLDAAADPQKIKPGQTARIAIEGAGGEVYENLSGSVVDLTPVQITEGRGVWRVQLRLLQKDVMGADGNPAGIVPGMKANADILTGRAPVMDRVIAFFVRMKAVSPQA